MQKTMTDLIPIALVDDDQAYAEAQIVMAAKHGFAVTWFKTWAQAKEHVRERRFKAVVLDAKGQIDEHSPTQDIDHLTEARRDLDQWKGANIHIPYVINTGFDEGATKQRRDERRYLKGSEKELYEELKALVDRSNEQALRDRYKDVFAVLNAPYLDPAAEPLFMNALLFVERGDKSGSDRLFMNPLRQVIEHLFFAVHRQGMLPDILVKPRINQRLSALYLRGERVLHPSRSTATLALQCDRKPMPRIIADALDNILRVTSESSHADETIEDTNYMFDNREALQEHGVTPYLLSTIVFQLMDVLVWFKHFADAHPDAKANRSWLHEEAVGTDGAPITAATTKELSRVLVKKRDDKPFAHAGDAFIKKEFIHQHGLVDGDMITGTAKRTEVKGETKWEFISLTKH